MSKNCFVNLFILLGIALLGLLNACNSAKPVATQEPILVKLGNNPIPLSDFKYVYEKAILNKDSLYTEPSVRDYLNLFVNFKLKVLDAKSQGIDTTLDFKRELATYEEQLAQPYLMDQITIDSLMRESYRRMQYEVNVSHILLKISPEAPPQDSLAVYNQLNEIRQKALNGEKFEALAVQYSQDPSVNENQGNLGYFTALQMVYPFETAAYRTSIGAISNIVRTQFGFHILKIYDRRPAGGKVTVAHIMTQIPRKATAEDSIQAKRSIDEIYARVQKGENWDELAAQFSDDASSKYKGGRLPEFRIGEVLPEIEQTAFAMRSPNEISKPIRSAYGWHILKLIERKGVPTFKEVEPNLKQEVTKESRYEFAENASLAKLRRENNFVENPKALTEALKRADGRLLKGSWSFNSTESLMKETMFSLKSLQPKVQKAYTIKDFFNYLYDKQVPRADMVDSTHYMRLYYQKFKDFSLIDFERKNLLQKRPEYRNLINEYREGMMLFETMRTKVWNRALEDTTGAKGYFQANREQYRFGYRATATIYKLASEQVFNQLKPYLNKTLYPVSALQLDNILFDKDDVSLNENAIKTINQIVTALKQEPSLRLELAAHADPAEKTSLSAERLQALVKYLSFKKVDLGKITTKDYGTTQPISRTDRSKNRRIEISVFSNSKRQLENILNENNPLNCKITEGTFQKGENELLDKVEWKPGSYTLRENGQIIQIEIGDIKEPRLKEFDEARGYVITDYQKSLENQWISELKAKYPVQINEDEVKKLIKK
ncbi:MAG: peptidylprolyl isomerase [Microscillaceae bacterium]|jgi:peptidyl-prolyl cis-trans isomerase SurA|nr:peptidylprolyl isomerase [Microscillaceae bacterium]